MEDRLRASRVWSIAWGCESFREGECFEEMMRRGISFLSHPRLLLLFLVLSVFLVFAAFKSKLVSCLIILLGGVKCTCHYGSDGDRLGGCMMCDEKLDWGYARLVRVRFGGVWSAWFVSDWVMCQCICRINWSLEVIKFVCELIVIMHIIPINSACCFCPSLLVQTVLFDWHKFISVKMPTLCYGEDPVYGKKCSGFVIIAEQLGIWLFNELKL